MRKEQKTYLTSRDRGDEGDEKKKSAADFQAIRCEVLATEEQVAQMFAKRLGMARRELRSPHYGGDWQRAGLAAQAHGCMETGQFFLTFSPTSSIYRAWNVAKKRPHSTQQPIPHTYTVCW